MSIDDGNDVEVSRLRLELAVMVFLGMRLGAVMMQGAVHDGSLLSIHLLVLTIGPVM